MHVAWSHGWWRVSETSCSECQKICFRLGPPSNSSHRFQRWISSSISTTLSKGSMKSSIWWCLTFSKILDNKIQLSRCSSSWRVTDTGCRKSLGVGLKRDLLWRRVRFLGSYGLVFALTNLKVLFALNWNMSCSTNFTNFISQTLSLGFLDGEWWGKLWRPTLYFTLAFIKIYQVNKHQLLLLSLSPSIGSLHPAEVSPRSLSLAHPSKTHRLHLGLWNSLPHLHLMFLLSLSCCCIAKTNEEKEWQGLPWMAWVSCFLSFYRAIKTRIMQIAAISVRFLKTTLP